MKKVLLLLIALTLPAFSQEVKKSLVKHWKISGEFTMAVAKAMPADGYDFRPVAEEMSFGQLMTHIAAADIGACANASGLERPAIPAELNTLLKDNKMQANRDSILAFVESSFGFCDKAVEAMTTQGLDHLAGPAARNLSGFEWLWAYFTHTAHHRGQAEVYLRLKGIKPPTYVF